GPGTAGSEVSFARRNRGCYGDGCDGFVCITNPSRDCPHDPTARSGNGNCRNSARSGLCDGPTLAKARGGCPSSGSGRRLGLLEPEVQEDELKESRSVELEKIRLVINSDQDIVLARQKGRALAMELGFTSGEATLIATAISELARNIVTYAHKGEITLG